MKSSEPLLKMYLLVMALFLAPGIMSRNIALDGTLSANEWDGSLSFDLEYESCFDVNFEWELFVSSSGLEVYERAIE